MPDEQLYWYGDAVQAAQIGTEELTSKGRTSGYSYSGWEYPAIFDTGTSLIYAPAGLGRELMLRMVKGNSYLYDSSAGMMIVECTEKELYEDLFLTIDGYKFQISVEDYFLTIEAVEEG